MKVALVHDWLTGMRGGERCLEVLCELFPDADLYTLVHDPGKVSPAIERRRIRTSFINRLPRAKEYYRYYLPLFPSAIERFDFSPYDLIISSSHCVAKGAKRPVGALHISYTYTPMRYAWDLYEEYFGGRSALFQAVAIPAVMAYLRRWDRRACRRVDHFVAISRHVAGRIRRHYDREATVIYPPVDIERFRITREHRGYYLIVSALVPYKRIDLAVTAFNRLRMPLKIVGSGPEAARLKALSGPTVEFLGQRSDEELVSLYGGCRALIFPGEEDFGIVPVEAQASGKPVIAYAKGGVTETVIPINPQIADPQREDAATGVFFFDQTAEALVDAVRLFEKGEHGFDPARLREHARQFDRRIFKDRIRTFIDEQWRAFQATGPC